ncbi:nuclear pore complex protein Nup160-like isoform X2 [Acanthaster planci]|uniref:Nuclear pore complex protein Nup160-like isoform X2 n=1 Tax=Acanthaster planci TaxID=133434 RepID=A0A8B7YR65_ACAPL|nr:nuclear pore complex protein Nup160-like isoform X2 [Acanthaster planci]
MAEPSSFHEVTLLRSESPRCKELTISTGASQGVLQDVNLPDCAGGYAYRESGRVTSVNRNRFIYWRTSRDVLELAEVSLDHNLTGNTVSLHLQDAPILPRITLHETNSHMIILVATINSVHRLVLPHPNRLPRHDVYSRNSSLPSIFADVSIASIRDAANFHVIGQGGSAAYEFQTSSSWLTNDGEVMFALATNTGSVVLVKLPPIGIQGIVTQHELKQATVMQRLWTGLVPAAMRRGQESLDSTTSLTLHPLNHDLFAFCACKDHKVRMWSCKSQSCVLTVDLVDYIPTSSGLTDQSVTRHEIRTALGSDQRTLVLGFYLSFTTQSQFLILQPVLRDGQYKLIQVALLNDDQQNTLVDFGLTLSTLWAVWNSPSGETVVKFTTYEGISVGERSWNSVFMEPFHTPDIIVPPFLEPREAYLDNIFHPGKFSLQSVSRALNIYSRSSGGAYTPLTDPTLLTPELLHEEVTTVMEVELQQKVGGSEMSQEEYREVVEQSWSRFYTCCVQYHEVASKPHGIMLDPNTGMVCLLKKNLLSLLRPCDAVEHLYLAPPRGVSTQDFEAVPFVITEKTLCRDLITLRNCVKMISQTLSPEIKMSFEHDVYQLEKPDLIAQQIAGDLLGESMDSTQVPSISFVQQLTSQLQSLQDPVRAVLTLLNAMDLAEGNPMSLMMEEGVGDSVEHLSSRQLFASSQGVAVLAASFVQMSFTRYQLLRDLLILECAMVKLGDQASLSSEALDDLESDIICETASCLLAYYSLFWVGNCVASTVPANSLEANLRQFAALEISDSTAGLALSLSQAQSLDKALTPTLAELFLEGIGGSQMRSKVNQDGYMKKNECEVWMEVLRPCLTALAQMVWPISGSFLFPEFLMGKCQYTQLQEYIRLLNPWCDWNISSRHFLLGHCLLNSGEPHKALACFLRASHRIANEDFLLNKLLLTEELTGKKLDILYYLKVIRLLEQFGLPDLVISLANTALSVADDDDPNVPTLWSKVFKYHLELGHNDEAYAAMATNPDPERRRDCLRQFVVVLCQRGQTKELCQFPYIDLHDEVVSIMESRARSVDLLTTHNYYDLLYAFHIFRGNYRKAASAVYEHAVRLGLEVPSLDGLRKQAKCYLAAMNALELVNQDFAWIIKPVAVDEPNAEDVVGASPKRNYDGEILQQQVRRQVKVIELCDLRKEHQLVDARLKLANHDPESIHSSMGPMLSADETVSLLVQSGLFDVACAVCKTFQLDLTPVFEGLATKCVKLSLNGLNETAWKWLSMNDLGTLHPSRELGPADLAWQLLKQYLEKHDRVGDHTHYKCVINKLLSLGYHLPTWLLLAYKKLNPASLLLLYITYDMLEEATSLALEFIDAVCGKGSEYFGLKTSLRATLPSVWLPYQSIDHLLTALKDQTDPTLKQLHSDLKDKLNLYHANVEAVSRDMIQIRSLGTNAR